MKVKNNTIIFEHLSKHGPEVEGQTREIKALKPEGFANTNAKGDFPDCDNLDDAYTAGIEAAQRLRIILA